MTNKLIDFIEFESNFRVRFTSLYDQQFGGKLVYLIFIFMCDTNNRNWNFFSQILQGHCTGDLLYVGQNWSNISQRISSLT